MSHEELPVRVADLPMVLGHHQLGVEVGSQHVGMPLDPGPHGIPYLLGNGLGGHVSRTPAPGP